MANKKISELSTSTSYNAATTFVPVVDTNDTSEAASGSNYKVAVSEFISSGSNTISRTAVSSNYSVLTTDNLIAVDSSSNTVEVELPAASAVSEQVFIVKDEAGAAETNDITITCASGDIDGAADITINLNHTSVTLYSNGTDFFII